MDNLQLKKYFFFRLLGTRTSLVTAGLVYVLFLAGFLNVHQWFLYGTSALLGLAAAVLWTAQGKYLTLNSTPQSAGRHSSLFLCCAQAWFVEIFSYKNRGLDWMDFLQK